LNNGNSNQRERLARNKEAYDEVIGDPYSKHDIVGQYISLRTRSSIKAVDNGSTDGCIGTANTARPNVVDFVCDVEAAIEDGLRRYIESSYHSSLESLERAFIATYLTCEGEYLNQRQRSDIEQIIGQLLIARKISPVVRYFTALRQKKRKQC
jgi:hypothetical protein